MHAKSARGEHMSVFEIHITSKDCPSHYPEGFCCKLKGACNPYDCPDRFLSEQEAIRLLDEICDEYMMNSAQYWDVIQRITGESDGPR